MKPRVIPIEGTDRNITLTARGAYVLLAISKPPLIQGVEVFWKLESPEQASQFVKEATPTSVKSEFWRFGFCKEFIERMEGALSSANTKETTKPSYQSNGSYASGRHGVRHSTGNRIYR